jgi:hypothetical protein
MTVGPYCLLRLAEPACCRLAVAVLDVRLHVSPFVRCVGFACKFNILF